jgi:hypothetical protein
MCDIVMAGIGRNIYFNNVNYNFNNVNRIIEITFEFKTPQESS